MLKSEREKNFIIKYDMVFALFFSSLNTNLFKFIYHPPSSLFISSFALSFFLVQT
jgi:hypothetical protein